MIASVKMKPNQATKMMKMKMKQRPTSLLHESLLSVEARGLLSEPRKQQQQQQMKMIASRNWRRRKKKKFRITTTKRKSRMATMMMLLKLGQWKMLKRFSTSSTITIEMPTVTNSSSFSSRSRRVAKKVHQSILLLDNALKRVFCCSSLRPIKIG